MASGKPAVTAMDILLKKKEFEMTNIKSTDVQVKHFLKADPYNEEYRIIRSDIDSENRKIVNGNREFFEKIVLKYEEQSLKRYYIESINEGRKVYSEELKNWVEKNIYKAVNDTLVYVEGYAGCGKTTWVQSILYNNGQEYSYILNNNNIADSEKEKHKDSYIDFYTSFTPGREYSSEVIRFNIVNSIVLRMIHWLKEDSGIDILNDFCDFLADTKISTLNTRLPNIIKYFKKDFFNEEIGEREETYFYRNARLLKNNPTAEQNFIDIFRNNINEKFLNTDEYKFSTMDILCLDCIWRIAQSKNTDFSQNKIYICYDNLDIIDDLEALANFLNELGNLKTNISKFRDACDGKCAIPCFVFFVTCRKITDAKLEASGLRLPSEVIKNQTNINDSNEVAERDQRREGIIKIELSHLYSYEKMAKKRAEHFINNINSLIDFKEVDKIRNALEKVIELPEGAFNEINYSGLWNHNHRACNNVLNCIIADYHEYYDKLTNEYTKQITNKYDDTINANTSILLHIIIKILNGNKEWEKALGYKDNKLTTMSRMILTYMHNKRQQAFDSVSILEIIKEFGLVSLELENNENKRLNIEYICGCLQNMLTRLPNESEEIWRRPLFYKHNALLCENKNIQSRLIEQIDNANEGAATSFIISDEGQTFIEKIVPQFEFYSARLDKSSIPLYCVSSKKQLQENIDRVYKKVEECCKRQIIFMQRYQEKYNIQTINDYLSKDFHPTTIHGDKQLHIIRVIFSHISFLNSLRDYLYTNNDNRFVEFNYSIISYIYKYLRLYDDKFYVFMANTIGEYNNIVWSELATQYNRAIDIIESDLHDQYGVSIERIKLDGEDEDNFHPMQTHKPVLKELMNVD